MSCGSAAPGRGPLWLSFPCWSVSIIIPKRRIPEEYQKVKRLLIDKLELKLVPDENVKIGIAMNEKIAAIAFPDLKGKMHTKAEHEEEKQRYWRYLERLNHI